jgi:hypothetical protein
MTFKDLQRLVQSLVGDTVNFHKDGYDVCIVRQAPVIKIQSTQIPGTATFLNRCGDIMVLGRGSAMLDRNSGLLKARLKCSADSQTT